MNVRFRIFLILLIALVSAGVYPAKPATAEGAHQREVVFGECTSFPTREERLDCATIHYYAYGRGLNGITAYFRSMGISWDEMQIGDPFQPDTDATDHGPRIWGAVVRGRNIRVTGNACLVTDVPGRIQSSGWRFTDNRYSPPVIHAGEAMSSDRLTEIAVHADCSNWSEIRAAMIASGFGDGSALIAPSMPDTQPPQEDLPPELSENDYGSLEEELEGLAENANEALTNRPEIPAPTTRPTWNISSFVETWRRVLQLAIVAILLLIGGVVLIILLSRQPDHAANHGHAATPQSAPVAFADTQSVTTERLQLPDGVLGQTYNKTLRLPNEPATARVEWYILTGNLPAGLRLSSDGVMYGAPQETGQFECTASLHVNGQRRNNKLLILKVNPRLTASAQADMRLRDTVPASLTIDATPPPSIVSGQEYETRLTTVEPTGATPLRWRIVRGNLPEGMFIDETTGRIYGRTMQRGNYIVRVQAVHPQGLQAERDITISVGQEPERSMGFAASASQTEERDVWLEIEPSLARATVGKPYRETILIHGLPPDIRTEWFIYGRTPTWLRFDPMSGTFSGIPTEEGAYTFTVQLNAAGMTTEEELHLIVDPQLPQPATDAMSMQSGAVNLPARMPLRTSTLQTYARVPYTTQATTLAFAPGTDLTWTLDRGELPEGLELHENGELSGSPVHTGRYLFTLRATHGDQSVLEKFDLGIVEQPLSDEIRSVIPRVSKRRLDKMLSVYPNRRTIRDASPLQLTQAGLTGKEATTLHDYAVKYW